MVRLLALAALALASPAVAGHGERARGSSADWSNAFYLGNGIWAPRQFSRDDGYFHGRGRGVSMARGEAIFDYDRDYPYDFPSGWGADEPDRSYDGEERSRAPGCSYAPVRDRRTGAAAEVRICR